MLTGSIFSFGGHAPRIHESAYIAPGAVVIGDVTIAEGASIWFNCVLRGDVAPISVGARTNIQDGTLVHADPGYPTRIGSDVLIGHMAIIHGCAIDDRGFVGMGATVLSAARIAGDAMLAAGAMLTGGKAIGRGELWAGRPARLLRQLGSDELADMQAGVAHYHANAARFREELRPA